MRMGREVYEPLTDRRVEYPHPFTLDAFYSLPFTRMEQLRELVGSGVASAIGVRPDIVSVVLADIEAAE